MKYIKVFEKFVDYNYLKADIEGILIDIIDNEDFVIRSIGTEDSISVLIDYAGDYDDDYSIPFSFISEDVERLTSFFKNKFKKCRVEYSFWDEEIWIDKQDLSNEESDSYHIKYIIEE